MKKYLIPGLLVICFAALLLFGIARPGSYRIIHDFPHGYAASDTFHNLVVAGILDDQGRLDYYPPYYANNYEDVIAVNPPVLYHISVIFSDVSFLPLYDVIYLLVLLFSIASIFAIFLFIKREFNEHVAFLSMPLVFFMYYKGYTTMFSWGIWNYVLASMLLIAVFYFIDDKILPIIFLTAMIHSHLPEFIFSVGLIAIYVLFKRFSNLKQQAANVMIPVILSSYFLWMFYYTWMKAAPFHFNIALAGGYTNLTIMDFGDFGWIFGVLIIIGMISVLVSKKFNILTLLGFFLFLIGFSNLIGFDVRAFQSRYFWPIYFAVFVGYFPYLLLKNFEIKFKHIYAISSVLSVIILVMLLAFASKPDRPGYMHQARWDSIQWTLDNTYPNETNLYIYSVDIDQPGMLWLAKRTPYFIGWNDFNEWLNKNISRYANVRVLAEAKSNFAYRDGFKFRYHWYEPEMNMTESRLMDICRFDYIHFSGYNPAEISQVHNMIITRLLLHNAQIIYNQDGILVIKNLEKGGECLD